MSAFAHWRLALRIARRDALRAKGRSALVVAMIALPILGVTAADLAFHSGELSQEQELTRELGQADARFRPETGGSPVMQSPLGDEFAFDETQDEADLSGLAGLNRPAEEVFATLGDLLPPGTEILSERASQQVVHTETGLMSAEFRELDAAHPATEGMLTLLRGDFPREDGEVAATQAFLDESGLRVSSTLRLRDQGQEFRISGAYELPGELDRTEVVGRPGALPPPEGRVDDWSHYLTYLAYVPDGEVTWPMVVAANEHGFSAQSRSVLLDPPPDSEVPLYQTGEGGEVSSWDDGADTTVVAVAVTAVSLIILEICLLAGPAFAVGARRSRRQLGLIGANGGDRRHLRAVMLSSGLVLGAVAAVTGVALGIGLVLLAHPLLEAQTHERLGPWDFRWLELGAIACFAVLVGLLAAVVPAINAARSSVLESLTGRRGTRKANRVLPVIGLAALLIGTAVAIFGGLLSDSTMLVAAGSVLAELGLVALAPLLVGAFGKLSRWLPLSGRLALRDAARNRGRTAPAVAAVLAAAAGLIAASTVLVSADTQDRDEYRATLPEGVVSLNVWDEDTRATLPAALVAAEQELPVDTRAEVSDIWAGGPGCAPGADPTRESQPCGMIDVPKQPAHTCPLHTHEAPSLQLTEQERRALMDEPRCRDADPFVYSGPYTVRVAGPELLSVLGLGGEELTRATEALERGEAVAFGPARVAEDETVRVNVFTSHPESYDEYGNVAEEPDESHVFPAHVVDREGYEVEVVISPATAEAAGLNTALSAVYYSTTETPSNGEQQAFTAALDELGTPPHTYIEDGYESETDTTMLILVACALLITLGAAGIATGLAQADSEADLATLASVGASPRVRRTLSGLQCGMIAAMGVVLGAVSGLIPAIGIRLAIHRVQVSDWEQHWAQGWGSGPEPERYIELPWETFAQLVVGVPVLACLLAALLTRSRIHLARRAG